MTNKRHVKFIGFEPIVPKIARLIIPCYLFRNVKFVQGIEIPLVSLCVSLDLNDVANIFDENGKKEICILKDRIAEELGEDYFDNAKRRKEIIETIAHEFAHKALEEKKKIYQGLYSGNMAYHDKIEHEVDEIVWEWEKTFEKNYGRKLEEVLTKDL